MLGNMFQISVGHRTESWHFQEVITKSETIYVTYSSLSLVKCLKAVFENKLTRFSPRSLMLFVILEINTECGIVFFKAYMNSISHGIICCMGKPSSWSSLQQFSIRRFRSHMQGPDLEHNAHRLSSHDTDQTIKIVIIKIPKTIKFWPSVPGSSRLSTRSSRYFKYEKITDELSVIG